MAYAAKGGSVAADGEGRNSPYSTALLAHVEEPGLEVGLSALTASGFDAGGRDGLFGPRTRVAIGNWQASRGEAATGYLDVDGAKTLLKACEGGKATGKGRTVWRIAGRKSEFYEGGFREGRQHGRGTAEWRDGSRDEGLVRNKAVYLALTITSEGDREVLGLWIEQTDGAKFWLKVTNELRTRGLHDT